MHSSRMCTAHSSSRLLGGLPQCMLGYPPAWAWRSPQVWPADPPGCGPPRPDPSTSPLGLGLRPAGNAGIPPIPPWRPARHAGIPPIPPWRPARHAGIPPAMHAGIPPLPCEQNDRQVQKYYLAPNFVCRR